MSSQAYLLLTLVFYTAGALHVLVHALTRRRLLGSVALTATLIGFALNTAGLSQRWTEAGRFPAVGLHDGASFLAWAIVWCSSRPTSGRAWTSSGWSSTPWSSA
jgi:ABC-type transport system involved in cytochrome c biogenesis permease subunit